MSPKTALRLIRGAFREVLVHRRPWADVRAWLASNTKRHSPLIDAQPWMCYSGIRWLDSHVRSDFEVFEYGSGGSTLFFAQRARQVTSVEHDRQWFDVVQQTLASQGVSNCRLLLHEPQPSPGAGRDFVSANPRFQGMDFESYVRAIDEFADASLDLVVVDGRARVACAKRALAKVRDGGYMLLDNSSRPRYRPIVEMLAPFPREDFQGLCPYHSKLRPDSYSSAWRIIRQKTDQSQ